MNRRRTVALVVAIVTVGGGAAGVAQARGQHDAPATRVVTIDIRYSRFTPPAINVHAGDDVRFVIRNGDPIDHEFIIGDAAEQSRHETATDTLHASAGAVSVPAGQTRTTNFRFSRQDSVRHVALTYACHLPGHFQYGMHGSIAVRT